METMMYADLINNFTESPRDVHTVPLADRIPVWFYTYADNGILYVEPGRFHEPKSKITGRRRLIESEYHVMLDTYHRRQQGEAVYAEVTAVTMCQVYWYGIFSDLNM